MEVGDALVVGDVEVVLVQHGQVQVSAIRLLTGEHVVDLRGGRLAFPGRFPLVCPLQVLDGLVGVSAVEIFDLAQVLVEFVEGVAGRDGLDLLGS